MKKTMPSALKIPYLEPLEVIFKNMGAAERLLVFVLSALLAIGALGMLSKLDSYVSTYLPAEGGSLTEGIIGTPRFINPLLALTDSDRDLVMLTFSGLMRATTAGELVPDIAESYEISEDGTQYTFILKKGLTFHDGKEITADDVVFTIEAAQDPALKSVKRADWDGVIVEKVNDYEIVFTLSKPFAPFLENTTLGILPKHLWENVKIQEFSFSNLNSKPIGSGPYVVDKISYDKSGIPKSYSMKAFKKYALGKPYIKVINLLFYNNRENLLAMWKNGVIDSISGISMRDEQEMKAKMAEPHRATYPRIFAVFFNQSNAAIFADKHVRTALDESLDKQQIVNEVMGGYATPLSSAIPPSMLDISSVSPEIALTSESRLQMARDTLKDGGWKFVVEEIKDGEDTVEGATKQWRKKDKVLEFKLATANTPELKEAATMVVEMWRELGVTVRLDVFDANELNQNVIRARNYDALLFGEVEGRSLDLFAFWHSSQRDDPGLNIAIYANAKMDKLLEDARTELDKKKRKELYTQISEIMKSDVPAVFLYSPDFIYILPPRIHGIDLRLVATPSERFAEVHKWYIETSRVWNLFVK